jgi:16S rRNA (uracil1498-N3)-methyltransferase
MRSAADALPSWVWVPQLAAPGTRLVLDADAAHHVQRVCRARPGDGLTLTDGRGGVAHARLEDVRPATALIEHLEQRPAPAASVLWCGAPEGDRADWLIEKLAELGLATFQPIETARSRWDAAPRRVARWTRLARAALQQSCGAWLLEIRTPLALDDALVTHRDGSPAWLADPAGERRPAEAADRDWIGTVGPSSGLTSGERDSLVARGFALISLGERRLRTETAALALVAWRAAAPRNG